MNKFVHRFIYSPAVFAGFFTLPIIFILICVYVGNLLGIVGHVPHFDRIILIVPPAFFLPLYLMLSMLQLLYYLILKVRSKSSQKRVNQKNEYGSSNKNNQV